jgi:spermidine/putrescine transport system permease protein
VAWLIAMFVAPSAILLATSMERGSVERGFRVALDLHAYGEALAAVRPQALRTVAYAGGATLLALVLAYPLAYGIARHARRSRPVLLAALAAPFFTTYLARTIAWKTLLADEGPVARGLRLAHLLPGNGHLIGSAIAVVGGLAYELMPFMALPIYVSLERADPRLAEASADLHARPWRTFRTITLPLSMPGVLAGAVLTFVPSCGDFVNAALLGGPRHSMVGNVVQSRFLVLLDYPVAAAISVVLMIAVTVCVLAYVRALGTRGLTG